MGITGGSGTRGGQRINNDFAARELGVAIEGLRLQRNALNPELAGRMDAEGAAMAEAGRSSVSSKLTALEFALRLVRGEIGSEGVNRFIEGAAFNGALGREAVKRVRGERER